MMNTKTYAPNQIAEQKKGFSAHSGENIGYEKGAKMVKNYFDQNQEEVSAHFLGRNIIEAILAQPGAVGITILYGINELGLPKPVVVGVNSKGDYILNVTSVGANGEMNKQKGIVAGGGVLSTGVPQQEGW
ncbi:hypothetical protein [Segetibacter aerophilus]|uniref:Uncharacterized protein n=1 Tax=Segetibacter aerophilus TaxID=670293 RepID=A0A512BCZ9_9BACT|nr:hypothetical protein [Segetibacter aerophilus]GEO09846.1 hypothetical protein SAE01_23420 [Segetibacter aerophilus]